MARFGRGFPPSTKLLSYGRFDPNQVEPGLIDNSGTLFGPSINQAIAAALIASTVSIFAPNVTQAVAPDLIPSNVSVFTPQVNQSVQVELIGSTVVLFTPSVNQAVAVPLINRTSYQGIVLTDLPTSYWRLGEGSGNPQDSADGNHVDTVGGTPTYGVTGTLVNDANTAVTFDGSTEYFQIPYSASLHPTSVLTIETWFKRAATGVTHFIWDNGASDAELYILSDDKVYFGRAGIGTLTQSSTTYADTNWHHVIAVKNGSARALYIDGVDVGTGGSDVGLADAGGASRIGAQLSGTGHFNGTLDEVAIYRVALTLEQAAAHYSAGQGVLGSAPSTPRVNQSVAPALIDQSGVTFAPTVNQASVLGLIDQSGVLFGPQINQSVAIGLIDNSGVTFDPRINQSVTPGLISNLGVTFDPTINQSVIVPLIGSTVSTFDPQINQQVRIGLIDQSAVIFAPVIQFADVQNVFPGLIDQSGVTFAPVIRISAAIGLIDQSAILYAPSINQQINVGLIGSTVSIFAPTAVQSVSIPLIGSNVALFEPTLTQRVVIGLIDQSAVTFNPNVQRSVMVGLIDNSGMTFGPTLTQQVRLDLIAATTQVFAPTVLVPFAQNIEPALIDNSGQVFVFQIATPSRKKGGAHVIEVRRPTQVVEAEFEFRWNVLALVDSAVLLSYQNYGYVLAELKIPWRTGAVVTGDRNVTWTVFDLDPVTKANRIILAMEIDPDLWLIQKKRKE